MPNHCFNEVKAKKEILDEIYDYEKEKELDNSGKVYVKNNSIY